MSEFQVEEYLEKSKSCNSIYKRDLISLILNFLRYHENKLERFFNLENSIYREYLRRLKIAYIINIEHLDIMNLMVMQN